MSRPILRSPPLPPTIGAPSHAVLEMRRGIVLPVVLVACVIMAALIVTFHFISATDYKQVGRLVRNDEAAAIADLAFDEVFLTVGNLYGPSASALPSWATQLLSNLESARSGAASTGKFAVKTTFDFTNQVPITQQAITASGLVSVSAVNLHIGPFQRVSPLAASMIYQEGAFGDSGKDRFAEDLTGPLVVEVTVNAARGPFNFGQKYLRGQELQITDTTPPAAEFAMFAYVPPPSEDYALNDLQRGGHLTVNPQVQGRVAVRGPLVLLTEDAVTDSGPPTAPSPPDPMLGGDKPPPPAPPNQIQGAWHYPDTVWTDRSFPPAWATVPTPRTIMHPASPVSTLPLDALLASIGSYVDGLKSSLDPRRSATEQSESMLVIKPFTINNLPSIPLMPSSYHYPGKTKDLGHASFCVGWDIDTTDRQYETIDKDPAGYFPPGAYLYSPLLVGKQTFNVVPRAAAGFHAPLVTAAAVSAHTAYSPGATVADGDSLQLEPVFGGGGGAGDAGILGVYSVAVFDSITYCRRTIKDLTKWVIDHELKKVGGLIKTIIDLLVGGEDGLVSLALDAVHMTPYENQSILVRRFSHLRGWVPSPTDMSGGLSTAELATPFDAQQATLAPYGLYYAKDHFWKNVTTTDFETAMLTALDQGVLNSTSPWDDPLYDFEQFVEHSGTAWSDAENAIPGGSRPTVATDERNWICKEHTQQLLANTAGKGASGPSDALRLILAAGVGSKGLRGISPLAAHRVKGVFGSDEIPPPTTGPSPDNVNPGDFPNGFYPPQFRQWETIINRSYPDMNTYLAAEMQGGVLQLRGAVMIQKMTTPSPPGAGGTIKYQGRGVIVCVTDDPAATTDPSKAATLDCSFVPADANSMLILAHRVDKTIMENGVAGGIYPALRLGRTFQGSVYSDTGVTPASGGTILIAGNLVEGLANKKALPSDTAPTESLHVSYVDAYAAAAQPGASRVNAWILEMGGEVSSVEPGP